MGTTSRPFFVNEIDIKRVVKEVLQKIAALQARHTNPQTAHTEVVKCLGRSARRKDLSVETVRAWAKLHNVNLSYDQELEQPKKIEATALPERNQQPWMLFGTPHS